MTHDQDRSVYALVRTHRMLQQRNDDDLFLGERFKFLVARWIVVLGVVFVGLAPLLGSFPGSALIVLVYCGATVYFELFPERAHQLFHGRKKQA